ncbi:MAG: tRNA 4-thiouridine(8) synthase ThiI [Clostridiales bacterium]|jgi:thiamine biosynthesis protein ThiI|nr:tRNA 4-thiouridine(8) synthase ThiI [Clostridiales bacterium]
MREVILCKYGELILKGANRSRFESQLIRELRRRAAHIGNFQIRWAQSTVYIEPQTDAEDVTQMYQQVKKVFGFASVTRAVACEKTMDAIFAAAKAYLPEKLRGYKTFRCEAKRSDKMFPLKSPAIAAEVGGVILEAMPELSVDLTHPDITVRVEIRDKMAYIHAGQERGAGGIPLGSGGKGLLLLSGGIDSPVAGYMMAKRGLYIDALHFESYPYTSEQAREKVLELAHALCEYCREIRVHVISLTHIQEVLRDTCEEEYFTLLLRRFMMELANRTAAAKECTALITGESLGQVASQTMAAICVTDEVARYPVLRPCIGLDKEEIVERARQIGTFDTSILPYEDCCTVFTPRHPKTRPELSKVMQQEARLDRDALLQEAWESLYTVAVRQFEEIPLDVGNV